MDCSDVQKKCQLFLDGELHLEQHTAVKSHLQTCRCCAAQYRSQEQFHGLVRKTLVQSTASQALRTRISAAISQSSEVIAYRAESVSASSTSTPRPAYASQRRQAPRKTIPLTATHFMSCAAVLMLALSGWLALGTSQVRGRCPLVVAAENAHDRIAAGVPATLNFSDDPSALTKHINATLKVLPRFAGIPNLTDCELQAVNCGAIECDGLPKGVFVKFVECKCGDEPVTLLVYDSDKMPGGEEKNGFIAATSAHHNVISWKSPKDGLVYVLINKGPLKHALEVAEIARK